MRASYCIRGILANGHKIQRLTVDSGYLGKYGMDCTANTFGARHLVRKYPLTAVAVAATIGSASVIAPIYFNPQFVGAIYSARLNSLPESEWADYFAGISDPFNIEKVFQQTVKLSDASHKLTIDEWEECVKKFDMYLRSGSLLGSLNTIKAKALEAQILLNIPLDKIIVQIINIYGDTIEAKEQIDNIVEKYIEKTGFVQFKILEDISRYSFSDFGSPTTKMIIGSLLLYPLDKHNIFEVLLDNIETDSIGLKIIKKHYDELSEYQKQKVLESVFIRITKEIKYSQNNEHMKDLITKTVQNNDMLKSIVCNQGRIDQLILFIANLDTLTIAQLMMALTTKKGDAMIAECIDVLGPIGIKLAQLYAEDAQVTAEWKNIIARTKEKNKPSTTVDIYHNIRNYGSFEEIGKCIGVGSIKQVHIVRPKDGVYHILGIRKLNCESKAKAVLNALKHIPEFRQIAVDLEKIIDSEVNLNDEAYAFDSIQTSRFQESGIIAFPEVVSSSLSTIFRTMINGDTINAMHSQGRLDEDIKRVISQFHTLTLDTCFRDGIVFSDLHMGNITFNEETKKITVIDVGQYKAITPGDRILSLWLMADLGSGKKFIHDANMSKLICLLNIKENDIKTVDDIFQDAYTCPVRERFSIVSNRLSLMGYFLPDSVMRICKMTDLVIQQREELGIKENTLKYIEDRFREIISYTDIAHISFSWIRRFGN